MHPIYNWTDQFLKFSSPHALTTIFFDLFHYIQPSVLPAYENVKTNCNLIPIVPFHNKGQSTIRKF